MANLYKRADTWWGRIQRQGKSYRRSLRTTSRQIAEKRFRLFVDELEAARWGERPRRSFEDAVDKFALEHLPNLKPASARRYFVSLKALGRSFGGKYLDQVTQVALYDFEQARRLEGVKAPTIRRDLACLSSIFGCAQEWEWTDANPIPLFMRKRRKKGLRESPPKTRYLSKEEEELLLAHATPEVRSAAMVAIDTGLRSDEQFSLTWPQVDLLRGEIRLTTDTKNTKARRVPILPRSAQILSQRKVGASLYVFCHQDGKRYRSLLKGLKRAAARAGIEELCWHDLRRTCGCRLLQDHGFSMEQVCKWLGHHSVTVTEKHYAFLEVDNLHAQIKAAHINAANSKA